MAQYDVVVTAPAAQDLQNIVDYIAIDLREPVTAKRQLMRIRDTVFGLADYPTRHSLVSDEMLAAKGYRMIVVDNYLVFYIVQSTEKTVAIIRVLHNRRDWMSILS